MNVMNGQANRSFWTECERQLFSMAAMEADSYQQILRAIRAVSDAMRDISSVEQLVAEWTHATTYFQSAAETGDFAAHLLPKEKIAGAAFALREREIIAEIQQKKKISQIEEARSKGEIWVMLDEEGYLQHGMLDPYRATEMHVASGLAIVSMTQADPSDGSTQRILSVVRLEPKTGGLTDAEPGIADWAAFSSPEEFAEERARLRRRIEDPDA